MPLDPKPNFFSQVVAPTDETRGQDYMDYVDRLNPPSPPGPAPTPLSPGMAQVLGGLADGTSTYSFLKRGAAHEVDPIMSKLGQRPLPTGLGVAGQAIGQALLAHYLKSKFPRSKPIVDAVEGNLGAASLGYGALNNELTTRAGDHGEAQQVYLDRLRSKP